VPGGRAGAGVFFIVAAPRATGRFALDLGRAMEESVRRRMQKTLAMLLAGLAVVLAAVLWAGGREVRAPAALEPTALRPPLTPGGTPDGTADALEDAPGRVPAVRAEGGPAYEPPLEAAETGPPTDLAAGPDPRSGALHVWTFEEGAAWSLDEEGDLVLRFPDAAPSDAGPWRARVWGVHAGRPPVDLGAAELAGPAHELRIAAADVARHDQVFVLRRARGDEPARLLAACAPASFDARDRVLECPPGAREPCTVLAWWRFEPDGSFGLRRLPLEPGRRRFVQAGYASLFTLETP
jgi:hypothetical protein